MYRFPLHLVTKPCLSEYGAIEDAMCPQNIIDSELLIQIIKKESDAFFEQLSLRFNGLVDLAVQYIKSSNPEILNKGFQLLKKVIYRFPFGDSRTIVPGGLLTRGIYYVQLRKYRLAVNDLSWYDSLDSSLKTAEEMVVGQILLCLSLYMTRDITRAKEVLNRLNAIDDLASIITKKDYIGFFLILKKYEPQIIYESKNVNFSPKYIQKKGEPLIGSELNCNEKYFQLKLARGERVFAKTFIEEDEIVVVEYPKYFQFSAPFLNCELCGAFEEQLYSCLYCRYKTYCSKVCLDNDWDDHCDECNGYKIGIIPMFEAKLLFRLFVQTAKYMGKLLSLVLVDGIPIRKPLIAWNFFKESVIADNEIELYVRTLLTTQPNLSQIHSEKWRQMVNTSFRLAVFVYNDKKIIEKYLSSLELTKDHFITLIGTLLLRLNCNILLKCQREQLLYPVKGNLNSEEEVKCFEVTSSIKIAQRMSANAFKYYRIKADADFVAYLNKFNEHKLDKKSFPTRKRHLDNPLSEYINKLIGLSLDGEVHSVSCLLNADDFSPIDNENRICKLSSSNRYALIKKVAKYFHIFLDEYFSPDNIQKFVRQEKLSLCINLGSFQNFGKAANIQLSSLACCLYVGIATEAVKAGTELSTRRGQPYDGFNNRLSLKLYLDGIYGNKLIRSTPNLDAAHLSFGLFCGFCKDNVEITPALDQCWKCEAKYYDLLNKNLEFITHVESEILKKKSQNPASERDLALLYGTYNKFLTKHFSAGHELRLRGILKFAEFLALQGFLRHASDVLHTSALVCMDDFYTYKTDIFTIMFNIIQIIMERYVENIYVGSQKQPPYLARLLEIALYILSKHEQNLRLFVDDEDIFNFCVTQWTNYNIWKQIVNLHFLMPRIVRNYLKEL